MSSRSASKSSLFLMEMVIALLFFSICSAICLRVFAAASRNTTYSRNLGNSSALCQSAAGVYKSCRGDIKASAEILAGTYNDGQAIVYYNSSWQATDKEEASQYMLVIKDKGIQDNLKTAEIYTIKCSGSDEKIFSIAVKTLEGE